MQWKLRRSPILAAVMAVGILVMSGVAQSAPDTNTAEMLAQNFKAEHEIGKQYRINPAELPPPRTGPIITNRVLTIPFNGQTLQVPPGFIATGPSQSWRSGGHRHWRVWVVGRQEFLPETGAERAVVDGAADLEQQIGPAPGPAYLLRLSHAAVHQEVGRALGQRRADPLPGPVPFGVIDQMGALGA